MLWGCGVPWVRLVFHVRLSSLRSQARRESCQPSAAVHLLSVLAVSDISGTLVYTSSLRKTLFSPVLAVANTLPYTE